MVSSLITPAEARARTGLSEFKMYDLINKNRHPKPIYPYGPRSPRFVAAEIDAFVETTITEARSKDYRPTHPTGGGRPKGSKNKRRKN